MHSEFLDISGSHMIEEWGAVCIEGEQEKLFLADASQQHLDL